MRTYYNCPKCGSRNIEKCKDGGLFDTVFRCLNYDYTCHNCNYEWDSDDPNDGYDPSQKKKSDGDFIFPF